MPASRTSRLGRIAGRASWNLIDQVLTALTNTLLFIVLANTFGRDRLSELDSFANAFYVFTMVIGVERALVGQVLGMRYSGLTGDPLRRVLSQAFGFILTVSTVIAVVLAGVGLALGGVHGVALMATSLVLPGLILQDACRMAFFAQSRAKDAALNDALWAVLQFSGVFTLLWVGADRVWAMIAVWGGTGTFCAIIALVRLGVMPDPRASKLWLNRTWDVSRFLLAENLLTVGAFNGGFLLVGAIVGNGAVSAIRGAQVVLGPLQILSSAMFAFTLPELSRRTELTASTRWRIAVAAAAGMLSVAVIYTIAVLLVPDSIGEAAFHDNWTASREILLPIAIGQAMAAASLGPAVSIYALGLARKTFMLMLVEAPLVLSLMLGGAALYGVKGAAWGLAINQFLLLPLWFLQLRSVLRDHPHPEQENLDVDRTAAQNLPAPPLDGEPTGGVSPGDPSQSTLER